MTARATVGATAMVRRAERAAADLLGASDLPPHERRVVLGTGVGVLGLALGAAAYIGDLIAAVTNERIGAFSTAGAGLTAILLLRSRTGQTALLKVGRWFERRA